MSQKSWMDDVDIANEELQLIAEDGVYDIADRLESKSPLISVCSSFDTKGYFISIQIWKWRFPLEKYQQIVINPGHSTLVEAQSIL